MFRGAFLTMLQVSMLTFELFAHCNSFESMVPPTRRATDISGCTWERVSNVGMNVCRLGAEQTFAQMEAATCAATGKGENIQPVRKMDDKAPYFCEL